MAAPSRVPHCGCLDNATKLQGKAHRPGVWKCKPCGKQFTVTVGTVFERSKIPLNKWLMALYLLMSSKKGMSTHQMHRMLGLSYESAPFMTMRLSPRLCAMASCPVRSAARTKLSRSMKPTSAAKPLTESTTFPPKEPVVALVERGAPASARTTSPMWAW